MLAAIVEDFRFLQLHRFHNSCAEYFPRAQPLGFEPSTQSATSGNVVGRIQKADNGGPAKWEQQFVV